MIETTSYTQKTLGGIFSQTTVTLLVGIVEILSFSIMSRLLTQSDFGYYAAITAITTVFASFSETGIGSAIIQRKEIDSKFINNSFTLSFIFGALITILLLSASKPLSSLVADESMTIPLMIMSITLLSNCLSSVNTSIMIRRLQFFQVGMITLVSLVITTVVSVILALKGFGYYAIITKSVLTSLLTMAISWVMSKARYRFELDGLTIKSILGFSGWLMASVFFRNIAQQLDKLLMGELLSVKALGAYNRPKEFINMASSKIGGIFDTALFPILSQIQDEWESLKRAYKRSLYYLNVASIVLAMGFVFLGELIIRIFFGVEWLDILPVFHILSICIIFNFAARLADCFLRGMGLTKQQFLFRIYELVLKLIGLLVSYKYGILGIALSVLVTDILVVVTKHIYIAKKIGITWLESASLVLRSCKVCIVIIPIMILSSMFLPHTVLGNILSAAIFSSCILICFLFFPLLVGEEYKQGIYLTIKNKFLLKFKKAR